LLDIQAYVLGEGGQLLFMNISKSKLLINYGNLVEAFQIFVLCLLKNNSIYI